MTPTKTVKRTPRKAAVAVPGATKPRRARRKLPGATSAPRKDSLTDLIVAALDDLKAQNVQVLDVRRMSDFADTIVVASGTSDRHVKSLAGRVLERAREAGVRALGMEGQREGEWVLLDLNDVIVHVMLPRVREFYALEKLWDAHAQDRRA